MTEILDQLVAMSQWLGRPEMECAILGEGNTSGRADDTSFWLKASGTQLATINVAGFVRVAFDRTLKLLDGDDLSDTQVKEALSAAKCDPSSPAHPSVEILLHAQCLTLPGINFVGHTHPIAVNALTCSANFESIFSGRLFPDEIVVLGPAPLLVPYVDPGLPLARYVRGLLAAHMERYGEPPRWILMQNHGLIALGQNPQQVQNVTAMAVKTARILLGAIQAGGPHFLSQHDVDRIYTRPDEKYRQAQIARH
jgi:rhamnose utilization protein RhaD (predicted bifunctional aldolase and dehydrogenase)